MGDLEKKPVNTAPEEEKRNIQADVDQIMKKYDRESNVRIWEGISKKIVHYCLAAFSLFLMWMNLFANWSETVRRPLFLGIVILFVIVVFPRKKGGIQKPNYIPWYDLILAIVGSGAFFYFVMNEKSLMMRATRITRFEIILGILGALILFECCRRVVGLPILIVASCFILYAFYTGKTLKRVVYDLFYTTNGIIGTPIGVCSTYIALFIIFGAFLEATGISNFFISCANAVAGGATGGPAKVAVISSALCGMVSGSSVGNTVTTGSVTIPMMKRTGYPPQFAGAVEAASSTGGQIMPPIMGAAAFLMAEMVGVPYSDIVVRAILPAILYFTGIFLQVHLRAKRLGLKGIPREQLPKLKKLMPKIYLLIPLVVLVAMIMNGRTMARSAIFATGLCIVVSLFNKDNRMTVDGFFTALEAGARNCLSIGIACGVAGVIAGVVTLTGLGQVFISAIVSVANGQLIIALFFTMVTCIILGMGVPTTANYIIMATTCAPILITGMQMHPIAANMFVFYFGIVADITPPVALAAYAGAAIAKANPMQTAFQATRLAIAAFLIPYIFALNPAMLFIDTNVIQVIQVIITSFVGMAGVAAGVEGYLMDNMNVFERILVAIGGLMMLYPGTVTDLLGIVLIVAVGVFQYVHKKQISKA
ncbi:MAG: TRAP transporter permease [Lawsonibacter sp.]|nr:TRAP transporter permease [Lawsonibacter sp.]